MKFQSKFYLFVFSLYSSLLPTEQDRDFLSFGVGYAQPYGFYNDLFVSSFFLELSYGTNLSNNYQLAVNSNYKEFQHLGDPNSSASILSLHGGIGYQWAPILFGIKPDVYFYGGVSYNSFSFSELNKTESFFKPSIMIDIGLSRKFFANTEVRLSASHFMQEVSNQPFQHYNFALSTKFYGLYGNSYNEISETDSRVLKRNSLIKPIYAARIRDYATNGIGFVELANNYERKVTNVFVETEIKSVTAETLTSQALTELESNESANFNLPLLLKDVILEKQETDTKQLKVKVFYNLAGEAYTFSFMENVIIHPKNTIDWQNTKHLGSFITPKQPMIMQFSRNILSQYSTEQLSGIPKKLQQAVLMFNALKTLNITYTSDPANGFYNKTNDLIGKTSLDYVMYSHETLIRRAGDCDDLTTLMITLLESIGIKTAVVTIPGHIYLMFDSSIPISNYKLLANDKSLFYPMQGTLWIPLEITLLNDDFLVAWKAAAETTIKHRNKENFEVIITNTMWDSFPPTELNFTENLELPKENDLSNYMAYDIKAIYENSYLNRVKAFEEKIKEDKKDLAALNLLGVLHAHYKNFEQSEAAFKKILETSPDNNQAVINLGNLYASIGDYENGIKYYETAIKVNKNNSPLRLNLARLYYQSGDKFTARVEYHKAIQNNSDLKHLYSYLNGDTTSRATAQDNFSNGILWELSK